MNKRGRILGLAVVVLLLVGLLYVGLKNNIFADTNTQAINLYVATNGVDTNNGSISAPFKTLTKARDYIRTIKPLTAPVVVNVRAGTYDLSYFTDSANPSNFSLDGRDSGTAAFPITYQAYENEQVTISGGQKITGWQKDTTNNSVYSASIQPGAIPISSLYINGQSAPRARTALDFLPPDPTQPKVLPAICTNHSDQPVCVACLKLTATASELEKDANATTKLQTECINKSAISLKKPFSGSSSLTNASTDPAVSPVVSFYEHYFNPKLKIASAIPNGSNLDIFFSSPAYVSLQTGSYTSQYYFDNVFEGLSQGEWYFNKAENKVYYWPKPGEDVNSADIEFSKTTNLVNIRPAVTNQTADWTKDENLVTDISFKNLKFIYTDYSLPGGYSGSETGYYYNGGAKAAISVFGANRIGFINNTFSNFGNFALDIYSKNFTFDHNTVFDTGAGAVKTGSDQVDDPATTIDEGWPIMDWSGSKNVFSNNIIHDTGKVFESSAAVAFSINGQTELTANKIYNAPYRGVSVIRNDSQPGEGLIARNEIYDVMQKLSDGGAIYTVTRAPVIIENNFIHDIKRNAQFSNYGIVGIYLDEDSQNKIVRNNVVETAGWAALEVNRSKNNTISNNIFYGDGATNNNPPSPSNGLSNIWMTAYMSKDAEGNTQLGVGATDGNTYSKNIFVERDSVLSTCIWTSSCNVTSQSTGYSPEHVAGSTIKSFDNNYYYRISGADSFLTNWTSFGYDAHSVINGTDPFASFDPSDFRSANFCLKEGPATGLGIQSIDMTAFGKTACQGATPSPVPSIIASVIPSVVPSPSLTAVSSPSVQTTSYTFPKGFSIFGATKSMDLSAITSGTGLYIYKFDGASNKWLVAPGDNFTIEPSYAYYIYNPSDPKIITLPFAIYSTSAYNLTSGWNLLYTSSNLNLNTLALSIANTTQNAQMRINANTIYPKIFIIDDPGSAKACSYFKILGSSEDAPDCTKNQLAISSQIPAGKAFWVYAR